ADKTIVGIPGRLQAWKRQDVFLRAAGILSEQHSSLRFLVIGGAILGREGVYPDELRRLAAELGLGDVVHFAGHQPDVYPWLDALDIVVHASSGEPFGMVIAEAMALGKPVISVADGGPLEIVEDGRSGLLVAPGDPARLAAAIDRVLADGTFAAALGAEAERRARSLFSEDHMARAFGEIIRSAVLGESQ
ncbi:MAG: glycosyltransferase, partial [Gaiellaceae bacterium]